MSRRAAYKLKSLGIFDMGVRSAEVLIDPDSYDAWFTFVDREGDGHTKIVIGIESEKFREVLNNALHEATELAYAEMRLRYTVSPEIGNDNGAYLFAMDHTAFSEATSRVATFINVLYPILKKEHEKLHAKSKTHRRR